MLKVIDFSFKGQRGKVMITKCFFISILNTNAVLRINIPLSIYFRRVSHRVWNVPWPIRPSNRKLQQLKSKHHPFIISCNVKYRLLSQMMIAEMKPVIAARSSLLDSPLRQTPSREPLWFKKPVNDLHGKNNISDKQFLQTALSASVVETAEEEEWMLSVFWTGSRRALWRGLKWADVSKAEQIYKRC